jgi:hypothetical protein
VLLFFSELKFMSAPLCKCNPPQYAIPKTAGFKAKNPGQNFWTCPRGFKDKGGCGFYMPGGPGAQGQQQPAQQLPPPQSYTPYPSQGSQPSYSNEQSYGQPLSTYNMGQAQPQLAQQYPPPPANQQPPAKRPRVEDDEQQQELENMRYLALAMLQEKLEEHRKRLEALEAQILDTQPQEQHVSQKQS